MNELQTTACRTAASNNGIPELTQTYVPAFDAWQTEHAIILTGDLPGVTADGLEVEFDSGTLSIHGRVEAGLPGAKLLRSEYGIGDFHRTLRISQDIDVDAITARLDHGVVTIELPIAAKAKPRRIAVTNG